MPESRAEKTYGPGSARAKTIAAGIEQADATILRPPTIDLAAILGDAPPDVGLTSIIMLEPERFEATPRSVHTLLIRHRGFAERRIRLPIGQIIIGRRPDSGVQLDDGEVSRLHGVMNVHTDGRITYRDLGSANGTTVNGQLIATNVAKGLRPGDKLRLGKAELEIE